jgi:hypothetical protein
LGLTEFVAVAGGKNDFHTWSDCCSKGMKRLNLQVKRLRE